MSQKHEFEMEMTCEGCSGAAKRVLAKLKGVTEADISFDMEKQRVYVVSSLTSKELLETLRKTGKNVSFVGSS